MLLRLLLAVHLLAAHATTPDAAAAAPSSRWARAGPAASGPCSAPGGFGAVIRGALGALGGLYAHSPLRGGRRDETPRTRSTRPRGTRGAADKEPAADANARGAAKRCAAPAYAVLPQPGCAKAAAALGEPTRLAPAAAHDLACAVESRQFFGAGRMKKWRGRCTDACDLLAQLVLHFGLAAGGAGREQGVHADALHLQFYDRECEEYIDLEECSWEDFVAQATFKIRILRCEPANSESTSEQARDRGRSAVGETAAGEEGEEFVVEEREETNVSRRSVRACRQKVATYAESPVDKDLCRDERDEEQKAPSTPRAPEQTLARKPERRVLFQSPNLLVALGAGEGGSKAEEGDGGKGRWSKARSGDATSAMRARSETSIDAFKGMVSGTNSHKYSILISYSYCKCARTLTFENVRPGCDHPPARSSERVPFQKFSKVLYMVTFK